MITLSIGQCATLACLLEVTAPKPGNVHRAADFADMHFVDFVASAVATGPIMERAASQGVGETVWQAVMATRHVTPANTNLGTILLLTPLAAVPADTRLEQGVRSVLQGLTARDAALVYQAIRTVQPGGLDPAGRGVAQYDVAGEPPADLLAAMRAAADWDLVARQYANDFRDLFRQVVPRLLDTSISGSLTQRIIHTHVWLMAELPDSLIARKCGREVANEAAARAGAVVSAGPVESLEYQHALADLDFWLRSDQRRNPGTTADLIAAGLFVALREGQLHPPFA